MDGYDKNVDLEKNGNGSGVENQQREEIFSKVVRAGKRTYFLDVKATRRNDYYLTITESKKRFNRDGKHYFEKHKIFLYKEDFDKFADNLTEVIDYIKANAPEPDAIENFEATTEIETKVEVATEIETKVDVAAEIETGETEGYSSGVEFDDLGDKTE